MVQWQAPSSQGEAADWPHLVSAGIVGHKAAGTPVTSKAALLISAAPGTCSTTGADVQHHYAWNMILSSTLPAWF